MSTEQLSDEAVLWYEKTGIGAPLLQIHGSAFGHRNFEHLSPLMAERFEVIDFDLPGYGMSTGGPDHHDFVGRASQVAELVERLGYRRIHVHGTSFGAMIAMTLAVQRPDLVDGLVLSCFLARYDHAARVMRATWKRAARDSGMEAVADLTAVAGFARSFYDRDEAQQQLDVMHEAFSRTTAEAFVAATESIERADLSPLIDQVRAPILFLAGAEDNMTPFRPAPSGVGICQIAERLPHSRTEVLPECGHYLVLEQPERAAELIAEFLSPPAVP